MVVLDTRDNEDSATMTRFPISIHKKSDALLKKLVRNLDKFGGSLGLKPLCTICPSSRKIRKKVSDFPRTTQPFSQPIIIGRFLLEKSFDHMNHTFLDKSVKNL